MAMRLVTIGRPRLRQLADAIEEYRRRIGPWHVLEWTVVAPARGAVGQDPEAALRFEGDRLLSVLKADEFVVLLAVDGVEDDSRAFAHRLQRWQVEGRRVAFVVGGAYGVDHRVAARSQWRWSLSRLTLPHELAQLVVVEQIYRAFTILAGHPYHKE
jgi:23S rRNA (pseudouridine1915-N3)-methyltransferase